MADPIIDDIKSRIDIVDIIRNYITLKQSGANFKGLCPFHGEKTPSFMVNRERQMYRCFGCGEAGDVFAFVMKQENIDFPNALQLLAAKAGVTLPEKSGPAKKTTQPGTEKSDLFAVNDLAKRYFYHILTQHPAGKPALEYLHNRAVTDESITTFQIGFAPENTAPIQALLAKNNIKSQAIQLAGAPNRFRNRIMFPLRDVIGQTAGFSGRAMGEAMPKYLNTAETALFHKNRFLYGLFEAKKAIGEANKAILVEGQLDLVLAHQAGTAYTVATSGTALTDDHLRILRRYTDTLHLALDSDSAGRKATERAIGLALGHGFSVAVIVLPDGMDPGDIAGKTPEKWREAVSKPVPAVEWLFTYYFPDDRKPNAAERDKIMQTIFPYIAKQDDPISQSWALQHLALVLGVTQEKVMHDAFAKWQESLKPSRKTAAPVASDAAKGQGEAAVSSQLAEPDTKNTPLTEDGKREKSLIGFLLVEPELLAQDKLLLQESDFTRPLFADLYKHILSWYNKATNKSPSSLLTFLEGVVPKPVYQAIQKLVFDTQTTTSDLSPDQLLHEYSFLVLSIRQRLRKERIENYAQLIAQAAAKQDTSRVRDLMQQMQNTIRLPSKPS